eukprot:TRINITY_DN3374_c0_g2_i1.p1 TRINITY_DN3374_c0_g2~~TRINITY_DN3374_c0_g2_i1.p1  ORF type:complete len:254 (+),score=46.91 TRINITY_DN3374_c0_g2_i1:62-823(+)
MRYTCEEERKAVENDEKLRLLKKGESTWGNVIKELEDTARGETEREMDRLRHPLSVIDFINIQENDKILDLGAGNLYWETLFKQITNKAITAMNPWEWEEEEEEQEAETCPQVQRHFAHFEDPAPSHASGDFDIVFSFNTYHDTVSMVRANRSKMNKRIFDLLAPGGCYVIADHSAVSNTGIRHAADGLHRIDEALVVEEVEAAGFALVSRCSFLRCSLDERVYSGWVPAGQPRTDRFLLKFVKSPEEKKVDL